MASAPVAQSSVQHELLADPRGRSKSRDQRMPSRSLALVPAKMGAGASKLSSNADKPLPRDPPVIPTRTRSGTIPMSTAYSLTEQQSTRQSSAICSSPTWSPRGSHSARTQAERDRREKERASRKEADEAKKRLKEFKDSGKRNTAPAETTVTILNADGTHTNKLQKKSGRRFSKQPPPAAMETQKLPAALRTNMERSESDQSAPEQQQQADQGRRSRSSSFSSIIRFVTRRSRSASASRKGSVSEDEQYMSDASTKSRSSFIGGVKLRRQEQDKPQTSTSSTATIDKHIRHSESFTVDMHKQIDQITGRASQDDSKSAGTGTSKPAETNIPPVEQKVMMNGNQKELLDEPTEVNANMGKRRSQRLESDQRLSDKPHASDTETKKRKQIIAENLRSSREASMNRMQNLVTPLRSAMKGGRETAKEGRTNSMSLISSKKKGTPSSPESVSPPSAGNYVSRSRLHTQKRSMSGWHDEMAVVEANEIPAVETTAKVDTNAANGKPDPLVQPIPKDAMSNSVSPHASDFAANKGPVSEQSGIATQTNFTHSLADPVVWKQPVKANKDAAAQRAEKAVKGRSVTDVDKLPSQTRTGLVPAPLFVARSTGPMLKDVSSNAVKLPSPTSPLSSDDENHGLRRHPAVMSWKAEKESPKLKYSSPPRSTTLPVIRTDTDHLEDQPVERTLRPEDHPSLAALRVAAASLPSQSTLPDYSDPIDRPFSIVPTPVASPAPNAKSTQPTKLVKHPQEVRAKTKAAAAKIIETLKQRQAEEAEAEDEDEFEDASSIQQTPRSSPIPARRHSTPPVEMSTRPADRDKGAPVFPFPERHEPLVKPNTRPSISDQRAMSGGKVSFHTPPESPRFLSIPTSYDGYRRNGASETSPNAVTTKLEEDVPLPVPVSQLAKPNPPFARNGRKTPSPNRVRKPGVSPGSRTSTSNGDGSKSYVYVNFSPATSTSTISLSETNSTSGRRIPKGFLIKNADGLPMDPIAKLFVICCECKKWHDVPSTIYREMAKGMREIDSLQDGVAEAKVASHGDGTPNETRAPTRKGNDGDVSKVERANSNVKKRRSGVISTVPCCWCKHEMSVICCEGWSTLCYMSAQYHSRQDGAKTAADEERERNRERDTRDRRTSKAV